MKIDKTLNQFIATILTIIMIVTVIPFVPVALGIETEAESGNYAYAETNVPEDCLNFTAVDGDVTIKLSSHSSIENHISLEYTTNSDDNWSDFVVGTEYVITTDKAMYIRAADKNKTFSTSQAEYYNFVFGGTGKVNANGSVMYLLTSDGALDTVPEFCFYALFQGCSNLLTAPELPATTLATACYFGMFANCDSLTKAPELPAEELAYACYCEMFTSCSSLTKAPELPAETLADGCYYGMFMNCSSLTMAPTLPAVTLTEECYKGMFMGCTNLNRVKVGFTDWTDTTYSNDNDPCYQWLAEVSTSGIFICPEELPTTTRGAAYIPEGWTVITSGAIDPGDAPQEASGYYLDIKDQVVTLATFGAIDDVPVITSVKNSEGQDESFSGLSFNYSIEQVATTSYGSVIYGDIYTVTFTGGGNTHTLMANCRTVVIEEHINRVDLDLALVDAKEQRDYEGLGTNAVVSHIITSGSVVLDNPVVPESVYDNLGSVIGAADSLLVTGTYGQIDVDQHTSNLLEASAKFRDSVDISSVKVEGLAVSAVNGSTIELAAAGVYKDKSVPEDKKLQQYSSLADGVYTFFVKVNAAGIQKNETIYVVVAQDDSPQGLASACAMSIATQLDQTVEEVFGANKDSLDLELLIRIGLGAATKPEKENAPSSGGNQGSSEQREKTIDDFVTFNVNGGVISWTAKPGASVKRIAINAITTTAFADPSDTVYIPIQEGATQVNALKSGDNYLKVLVQTGNLVKTYYKQVNVPSINKPAVNVYSDGIGIYTYGASVDFIGYKKGAFNSFSDMNNAEGDMYYTINKNGVILDKSKFEKATYTFFFGLNSYVQVTIR